MPPMAGGIQVCLSNIFISLEEVCIMSGEDWGQAMRAIWLLNTIEVELNHLGIPLMRVPPTLQALGDRLAQADMSSEDRELIDGELTRAHASLAQVVEELRAGMDAIQSLLLAQTPEVPIQQESEDLTKTGVLNRRGIGA